MDEIRFKFLSDSVLKAFEKDGRKYCRLTASSNSEDLVGDVMSQKALEQMKSAAVGTVMFMNHSTNVPEDVFGTVAEATVEKKTADLVGGGFGEVYCLEYLVEVQTDNERAVKTWQMIGSGTKLGASVTVLVRDKSPNPKRSKGIIIEEVEYIETSIVGVPCNRQSWVSSAQKALRLAEKRASRAAAESNTEEEEVMSKENDGAAPRPLSVAFPLTVAAMEKGKEIREAISKGETVDLEPVTVKGMFNEILAQEPTLWELYDILCDVKWKLACQVWNLQALGQTDFTEITGLWGEALDEFKAAAVSSFMFWNGIAGDDAEAEADDGMLSYALELEKSLNAVAGTFAAAPDDAAREGLKSAGERIVGLARSIGIVPEDSAAEVPQIPEADEMGELRKQLEDAQARETELRKELAEERGNLEIAKAGLKAANGALGHVLERPLAAEGAPATS